MEISFLLYGAANMLSICVQHATIIVIPPRQALQAPLHLEVTCSDAASTQVFGSKNSNLRAK